MHEEGVWTLAADEGFETIYSGGRDKKVYAIELSQGKIKHCDQDTTEFRTPP